MSILARLDAVAAYAQAVRDHLHALDVETIDELTGGLEADLVDALADQAALDPTMNLAELTMDDMVARFGPAGAYADELRQAAGVELPAGAPPRARRRLREALADTAAGWRADVADFAASHRWLAAVFDLLAALRPLWWLARAWVVFCALQGVVGAWPIGVPSALVEWVILGLLVVLSAQWGRQRFGQRAFWRSLGQLTSAVTAVALPFLLLMVTLDGQRAASDSAYNEGYTDGALSAGLTVDGPSALAAVGATNLFIYGPDGEPIDGAQIVDQDGRPLVLLDPWGDAWDAEQLDSYLLDGTDVPAGLADDESPLNVYPYRLIDADEVTWSDDGEPRLKPEVAEDPRWPAGSLFPVPGFAPDAASDGEATEGTFEPAEPSGEAAAPGDAPTAADPTPAAPAPEPAAEPTP